MTNSIEASNTAVEASLDAKLTQEFKSMNSLEQEVTVTDVLSKVNKSSLLSTIAAELYHESGLEGPAMSLIVATAYVGALDYIEGDYEDFLEALVDGFMVTTMTINDEKYAQEVPVTEGLDLLKNAGFLGDNDVGDRLIELLSLRKEAYAPTTGEVKRRFGYSKVKHSKLFVDSVHILEQTRYTVDQGMLELALEIQAEQGGVDNDPEAYVLEGCKNMDANLGYVSEFKGDNRGRSYRAACHGPSGESSDRSRAVMDLYGVPTDYDPELVMDILMEEIADMTSDVPKAAQLRRQMGDKEFIIHHLKPGSIVSKPYCFVKTARLLAKLQAGERPYIGMAVGKDAKCSGPQIGALLVGDQDLAAACGFSIGELDDAYLRAIAELHKAGFTGLSRGDIKRPYMGIFYGQSYGTYTNLTTLIEFMDEEPALNLWASLYGKGMPANEDTAKRFWGAVNKSFGNKLSGVRRLIRQYGDKTQGRTKHILPDGFEVAMNYKVMRNAFGDEQSFDSVSTDVRLYNNAESYKFINYQVKTLVTHEDNFARTGFVNMIQAVDGLISRMVAVNLHKLGAKHVINIHDCFRVNVHDMEKLDEAIILAYKALFGSRTNAPTKMLPMGTDILGMYFEGANKQLVDPSEQRMVSQFFSSGKRRFTKVHGVVIPHLINLLGDTKYFAK